MSAARPDRIDDPWGERTPYARAESWPVRVDTHLGDGVRPADVDRWVQTASVLHSNGDALDVAVKEGRLVGVRGRAVDRVTAERGNEGNGRYARKRLEIRRGPEEEPCPRSGPT